MDNKPSLSQYFGTNTPPASQFFDEIGTSPSDMIQSIYLGNNESNESTLKADLFPIDMNTSNAMPTVSTAAALPATSLPHPSTFFDTLEPEPLVRPLGGNASSILLAEAIEGLSIKTQPVDKEADRRRDAWIPNEEAKKTLMKAQSTPRGSFFPEREVLTMPGIAHELELNDMLQEVSVKYLGVASAASRKVTRAEHVSRDDAGLRELLRTGNFRAAINLTSMLLSDAMQGVGRMHRPSRHTPRTLQLWLTRFSVMMKLKLHQTLYKESEPFGDCGKPDLFYQFYPEKYEGRTGSLMPFSMRLLIAELPGHIGHPEEAINKLYSMLDVINTMLQNLKDGKTEDGEGTISSEQDRTESIRLWKGRYIRVVHSIINFAISMKDYRLAVRTLSSMADESSTPAQLRATDSRLDLVSALCRLWLLCGYVKKAESCFEIAKKHRLTLFPMADVREYVDMGLIDTAHGKYQEAYGNFARAANQEPTNIMVANNLAVCLLYTGRLKDAIAVLQKAINSDPMRGLNECLLMNLCTLYELESSKTHDKKMNLLRMLCKYKSDTMISIADCLKLG